VHREFWLARWTNQEIGFHQPDVNPWLQRCWPRLEVPRERAVFVPLCGKSRDMAWLAQQGHPVVGVELAEAAVRAFYDESGCPYRVERQRHLQRYHGGGVAIFCGDFMDLTALHLRGVAGVYDRAALVALPPKMRAHYADHLQRIVPDNCRMLLLTLEYDQSRVPGPPHSVTEAEVRRLFGARCVVERLCCSTTTRLPPKFAEAGVTEAVEVVYRLVKQH
jgi:thiopurine S-methyltransferase